MPMPVTYSEKNMRGGIIAGTKKVRGRKPAFSSLSLAFPFQPSLWDDHAINESLNDIKTLVQNKLKKNYDPGYGKKVLGRIEKILAGLNYATHRKSVAIIITPDEEKVLYLNFPVKPTVFPGKSPSLLDLVSNIRQEADFYLVVLQKGNTVLYDYHNNNLGKIFEQKNVAAADVIYKNTYNLIGLLNSNHQKPVVITGSPGLVEIFCNNKACTKIFFTLLYDPALFTNEETQLLAKEIVAHWDYWQSKFLAARVLIAGGAGTLISRMDAVLNALEKNTDGLLLLDKRLKNGLQKEYELQGFNNRVKDFLKYLESFLLRGQQIIITKTGLLQEMGGIALLYHKKYYASGRLPYIKSDYPNIGVNF
jgi:hypothetical protein